MSRKIDWKAFCQRYPKHMEQVNRTCRIGNTWLDRLERHPRKARRAKSLLVAIARVQAQCDEVSRMTCGPLQARMKERAATWKQREARVQLWVHWEEGGFHAAKALLVKAEKEGQQDFFPLL